MRLTVQLIAHADAAKGERERRLVAFTVEIEGDREAVLREMEALIYSSAIQCAPAHPPPHPKSRPQDSSDAPPVPFRP